MRRALPGGAFELLRGFGSPEPGVVVGAGGVVPAARGWDGRLATSSAGGMGGAYGGVVVGLGRKSAVRRDGGVVRGGPHPGPFPRRGGGGG